MKRLAAALVASGMLAGSVSTAWGETITLTTNDALSLTAFSKPSQGWWSKDTTNIASNTNYITGTSYDVSPGVDYSYRSFFTFALNDPKLAGYRILGASLELQAFQGQFDDGLLSLYDVDTDPFVLNSTIGVATTSIWDDLGSGRGYGTYAVNGNTPVNYEDILEFEFSAAAVEDLNAALGNGFFSIGLTKELRSIFSGSTANGNQRLVLEVAPIPIPAALPLLMSALGLFGFIGWRRKRLAAA